MDTGLNTQMTKVRYKNRSVPEKGWGGARGCELEVKMVQNSKFVLQEVH